MANGVIVKQITDISGYLEPLSDLLIEVVEHDASIGFLPPLGRSEAEAYWTGVPGPGVVLFIAEIDGRIAGTVQLHLCMKPNGRHRAEIAKLMTAVDYRRRGVARLLMEAAEKRAKEEGRSLLVLDTRDGDPSNRLYASIGYISCGQIPAYAESADGSLDATNLYYKLLP